MKFENYLKDSNNNNDLGESILDDSDISLEQPRDTLKCVVCGDGEVGSNFYFQ
jgi:hypothetical protein